VPIRGSPLESHDRIDPLTLHCLQIVIDRLDSQENNSGGWSRIEPRGLRAAHFRELVMMRLIAKSLLLLGGACAVAPAWAGPYVCLSTISEPELVHRVKQDAYFTHGAPLGKRIRIEYDGCGYRIHVGEGSPNSRAGDLLLVDRQGRVTKVVHQR
jgi:hypothetical protein